MCLFHEKYFWKIIRIFLSATLQLAHLHLLRIFWAFLRFRLAHLFYVFWAAAFFMVCWQFQDLHIPSPSSPSSTPSTHLYSLCFALIARCWLPGSKKKRSRIGQNNLLVKLLLFPRFISRGLLSVFFFWLSCVFERWCELCTCSKMQIQRNKTQQ